MTDLLKALEVSAGDLCKSPHSYRAMVMAQNTANKVNILLAQRIAALNPVRVTGIGDPLQLAGVFGYYRKPGDTHEAILLGVKDIGK